MSIELSLGTAKAVIFDLDGTLYNKKGLPLRLIAADVPHMFMLGNERKSRKELMGRWFGDERARSEHVGIRMTMAMAKDLRYMSTLGTNTLLLVV